MSKDELLKEILRLPINERRELIGEATDSLAGVQTDPDMTAELRAELDRRYADALRHPEDGFTWKQACVELDQRKNLKP